MAELKFIADDNEDGTNILDDISSGVLVIYDENEEKRIEINAPSKGWTYELLMEANKEIDEQTSKFDYLDAYIAGTWIGSTEI